MPKIFIIIPILSLLSQLWYCKFAFALKAENNQKTEILRMDPTNLDIYFFQVAVSALFKAKANFILRSLPHTERIVFRQCVINTQGKLNLLAKCMVSLFNVRDNFRHVQERRNTKFRENLKINYLNNQEWPFWTQIFKFNQNLIKNPSNIFQPKSPKHRGNFTIFKILMQEKINGKKINEARLMRMKQRSNRKR